MRAFDPRKQDLRLELDELVAPRVRHAKHERLTTPIWRDDGRGC